MFSNVVFLGIVVWRRGAQNGKMSRLFWAPFDEQMPPVINKSQKQQIFDTFRMDNTPTQVTAHPNTTATFVSNPWCL